MPGAQDRWGQLTEPGAPRHEAIGADRPYGTEQPERGSIGDLRRRMERLPPGHPSSPYDDDMTPKPPVARLKDLELPLTGTEQSSNGASAPGHHRAEGDRAQTRAAPASSTQTPAATTTTRSPAASSNGITARSRVAAALGSPEQLLTRDRLATADEPYGTAVESDALAIGPDGYEPHGAPGPADPADEPPGTSGWLSTPTWADAGLEVADAPVSEDLAPEWEPAGWDDAPGWHDAPGWDDAPAWDDAPERDGAASDGASHEWTEPGPGGTEPGPGADTLTHSTIDADPVRPGHEPLTGPDGSWQWNGRYLTPGESRIADGVLGRCRIAEGRNVFGGYGHSGLTPAMRRIEAQLEHGQLLPDTEISALKPPDSFKEKLADLILRHPDKQAEELALEVHDGIRYAFIFDAEHYADGTLQAHSRFKGNGFELEVRRNCWQNPGYKGINTRWRDPAHDLVFEVRFHTAASWEVSQRAHRLYEAITDPATPPGERARLLAAYAEMSAAVAVPRGCATIPDYRKEA